MIQSITQGTFWILQKFSTTADDFVALTWYDDHIPFGLKGGAAALMQVFFEEADAELKASHLNKLDPENYRWRVIPVKLLMEEGLEH